MAFHCRFYNPQNSLNSTWHSSKLPLISHLILFLPTIPIPWILKLGLMEPSSFFASCFHSHWSSYALLTCLISTQHSGLRQIPLFQKYFSNSYFKLASPSFSYWSYNYYPSLGLSWFSFIYSFVCLFDKFSIPYQTMNPTSSEYTSILVTILHNTCLTQRTHLKIFAEWINSFRKHLAHYVLDVGLSSETISKNIQSFWQP